MPHLIKNRDFVFSTIVREIENGFCEMSCSVVHPEKKKVKNMVRANLLLGGTFVHNVSEGCWIDYVVVASPKGLIPN